MTREKLQTGLRTAIVLVACCAVVFWAWRHVADSNNPQTTRDWIRAFDTGDLDDRRLALQKLELAKPDEIDLVIAASTRALSDRQAPVRVEAALVLARFATPSSPGQSADVNRARSIAKRLFEAFQSDQDASVRTTAATGLGTIYSALVKARIRASDFPESDPLRPETLVAAFDKELERDPANRIALVVALERLGSLSMPAPPGLLKVLADPSYDVRGEALKALSHFSGDVDQAIPVLINDLATNPSPFPPDYAAIAKTMHVSRSAVPILLPALESNNGLVREAAAAMVARIEPPPLSAAPSLIVAVKKAIAAGDGPSDDIDPLDGEARPGEALAPRARGRPEQPSPDSVSPDLATALARAAAPAESVPLLIDLLKRKSRSSRSAAAVGLAALGPTAHAAIPALVTTMQEAIAAEHSTTVYGARTARALGRIAPQSPDGQAKSADVIAALTEALDAPDASIRTAAAEALGNFGPKAAKAIPRLRELLHDRNDRMQVAAKSALMKIELQSGTTQESNL
jgi:HEAT repeat protein